MPRKAPELTLEEELEQLWDRHQTRLDLSDSKFTTFFLDSVARLAMHRVKVSTYKQAASDISPDVYATANKVERSHARRLEKLLQDRAKGVQGKL
jgi:hypothetical protein